MLTSIAFLLSNKSPGKDSPEPWLQSLDVNHFLKTWTKILTSSPAGYVSMEFIGFFLGGGGEGGMYVMN